MAKVMISYSQKCDICGKIVWHSAATDTLDEISIPVRRQGSFELSLIVRTIDVCPECLAKMYECISEKYTAEDVERVGVIVKEREKDNDR